MHSTKNYIQYPVINHNGKEHKEESTHMYNSRNYLLQYKHFQKKITNYLCFGDKAF